MVFPWDHSRFFMSFIPSANTFLQTFRFFRRLFNNDPFSPVMTKGSNCFFRTAQFFLADLAVSNFVIASHCLAGCIHFVFYGDISCGMASLCDNSILCLDRFLALNIREQFAASLTHPVFNITVCCTGGSNRIFLFETMHMRLLRNRSSCQSNLICGSPLSKSHRDCLLPCLLHIISVEIYIFRINTVLCGIGCS